MSDIISIRTDDNGEIVTRYMGWQDGDGWVRTDATDWPSGGPINAMPRLPDQAGMRIIMFHRPQMDDDSQPPEEYSGPGPGGSWHQSSTDEIGVIIYNQNN